MYHISVYRKYLLFSYMRCCHYVKFDFLLTNLFLSNRNLNQCVNKSDDLAPFNSLKNSVWQVPEEKKFKCWMKRTSVLPVSRKKIRRSAPETTLTISVLPLPLFSSFSLEVMWVYVQKKSHNFQQQHFRICISGRAEINIV